jgi:hypothetical protein
MVFIEFGVEIKIWKRSDSMTSFLRDIEFCEKWVTKFCNQHPSGPLSRAVNMKKKHDVKLLADKIQ